MKKFGKISAVIVLTSLLCGCSAGLPFTKKVPDFSKDLDLTAEINCGEFETAADVVRNEEGWAFSFSKPDTLSGIVLKLGENEVKGELGSLNFTVDDNDAYALYPEIIARSVQTLSGIPSEKMSSADGVLTVETEFEGQKVTIAADEETGRLISLKCPYYRLSVNFT